MRRAVARALVRGEPHFGAAGGAAGVPVSGGGALADAGAADAGVVPAVGGGASGVVGVCGIGCAGGPKPPAALAPAANPRPNSPPMADDIALDTAWFCAAAGFAA